MTKLIGAWLATLALAAIVAASCSINHKSDDYTCTTQADCGPDRVCSGGYCVLTGVQDAKVDSPTTPPPDARPDAATCPPQCTSCNLNTKQCNVDCAVTNCTNAAIVCPAGWDCDIKCSTNNACAMGVNCANAASCALTCSGQGSCRNVNCGTGRCDITCEGQNSCRGINCSNSCACDIACKPGVSNCTNLFCSDFTCRPTIGAGCSSDPTGCDTCQP